MKQIGRAVRLRATRVQYLQIRGFADNTSPIPLNVIEMGGDITEISGLGDKVCDFLDVVLREVYGMSYEDILNPDHDEWHPIISDHMSFSVTAKQKHSKERTK